MLRHIFRSCLAQLKRMAGRFFASSDNSWAKMDLIKRRMIFAPVSLNGRMLEAVVDSGTSRSVINGRLAEELGLVPLGKASVTTFTREITGREYMAQAIELGGTMLRDCPLDSFSTTEINAVSGQKMPLIVGRDVLQEIDLEVDFVGDRVRWCPKQRQVAFQADQVLPLRGMRGDFPSIDMIIEGMMRDIALIDLGSDMPITMSADYARSFGLLDGRRQSSVATVTFEGVLKGIAFSLRTIKIGKFEIRDVPVQAVENYKLALPISLGWPMFQAFHTLLSFRSKTMCLKADRISLLSEIPRDRMGISGWRQDGRLVIIHVAPGSPAWDAGIRADDVVVSVDGAAISHNHPPPGERVGFRAAGTKVNLGLDDGRIIKLLLKNYF